jgi:hypothetical protein
MENHMAQKVQVVLVDDLDGGAADQTVTFSFAGLSYEIDLSDKNADEFAAAMATYIGHGRRIGSSARRARRSTSKTNPTDIREWAKAQGIEVNERGRISAELRGRYEAAHR